MKSRLKVIILNSTLLKKYILDYGFLTKFKLRLFFFNIIIGVLTGSKHGKYLFTHYTSRIIAGQNLHLEGNKKGTFASLVVSGGCYLQAGNGIKLGEGTIFAPNVAIISANHDMSRKDKAWLKQEPIEIGSDCWLGTGCTILPGVKLGNRCVVAAGAVVSKSFPDDGLVIGGVPAKVISRIDN
ncbi:acyltransferase [Vibrio navarrensis]|uniref:acyltransferase n=1 Tax=Vibrio navarrensis TaxID=29495 RepID=UPI0013029123|nr:acyltransferase [Vibrio navarrensis]